MGTALFSLEFKVTSFREDPFDHPSFGEPVLDVNADECAILRVETDVPEEIYIETPRVYKKEKGVGVSYFYISHRKGLIKFTAKGYMPTTYTVTKSLQKGVTYEVKIKHVGVEGNTPVLIRSEPKDAEKFINGTSLGKGEKFNLKKGELELELRKEGYRPRKLKIDVSKDFTFENLKLEKIPLQSFLIESFPSNSSITIDNSGKIFNNRNKTPYRSALLPGEYNITISKSGYFNIKEKIIIKENSLNKFSYNLVKNCGFANFKITPSFALMEIDNTIYRGLNNIELVPGRHKVKVTADGYHTHESIINVSYAKTISQTIDLTPRLGSLKFDVTPDYAKITLKKDGTTIKSWSGKEYLKNLLIGDYQIIAKASGYFTKEQEITIKENKTTNNYFKMKSGRDPESYSKYELREKIRSYKKKKYITLAITLVGYAVASFMQYEAYDKYDQYKNASSRESSISLREDSKKWNNASYIAGGVSSVPWVPFFYYNHKQHFYEDLLRRK